MLAFQVLSDKTVIHPHQFFQYPWIVEGEIVALVLEVPLIIFADVDVNAYADADEYVIPVLNMVAAVHPLILIDQETDYQVHDE